MTTKKKVAKKKLSQSPTQLSLKWLRQEGYTAQVVERWNPHAKVRQDLFGWCDIIALSPELTGIQAVQVTSRANVGSRVKKIWASDTARLWLHCGGHIRVHGWDKYENKMRLYVTVLFLHPDTEENCESSYEISGAFTTRGR